MRAMPPLGRIDVVEAFEAGGIFDVAKQRQRMPPHNFARCCVCLVCAECRQDGCGAQSRGKRRQRAALQKVSSGNRQ